MANDRNAGRKRKYDEVTEMVTFRVPASKKDKIKKLVREWLKEQIAPDPNYSIETMTPEQVVCVNEPTLKSKKKFNDFVEVSTNEFKKECPAKACDCYMDGAIMKRGKSACRLKKAQHNF